MDTATIIELLQQGNQLKRTVRSGWVQRGVADAENVAAHSFGVVYATLLLAQLVEETVDLGRALAIAALHDLPEGLTTDIPSPAWRFLPPGAKMEAERLAMSEMVAGVSFAPYLMELWEELQAGVTSESRLVHDADKIDMFLQAAVYETQSGNRQLAEFWRKPHVFFFPETQAIYDALRAPRAHTSS